MDADPSLVEGPQNFTRFIAVTKLCGYTLNLIFAFNSGHKCLNCQCAQKSNNEIYALCLLPAVE